jgi:hypothetical protein
MSRPLGKGGCYQILIMNLIAVFFPPQLGSKDGDFDNFEYFEDFGSDAGINDDDHDEEGIGDLNGVKFMYRDNTWNQDHFTYEPKRM